MPMSKIVRAKTPSLDQDEGCLGGGAVLVTRGAVPCRFNGVAKLMPQSYSAIMRVLLLALILASCVKVTETTAAGGIIKVVGNKTGTALHLAQAHCAQYGKNARISGQDVWNNTVTFDCV